MSEAMTPDNMNQCDGCQRRLPTLYGWLHYNPEGDMWDKIACTKERYVNPTPDHVEKRGEKYWRDLPPHVKGREGGLLIRELLDETAELRRERDELIRVNKVAHELFGSESDKFARQLSDLRAENERLKKPNSEWHSERVRGYHEGELYAFGTCGVEIDDLKAELVTLRAENERLKEENMLLSHDEVIVSCEVQAELAALTKKVEVCREALERARGMIAGEYCSHGGPCSATKSTCYADFILQALAAFTEGAK